MSERTLPLTSLPLKYEAAVSSRRIAKRYMAKRSIASAHENETKEAMMEKSIKRNCRKKRKARTTRTALKTRNIRTSLREGIEPFFIPQKSSTAAKITIALSNKFQFQFG